MNFPMPITANNYDKIVKKLLRATKSVAEVTMQDASDDLHAAEDGVVTVISMKNGKVLDVEAMSRVCKWCTLNEELRIKDSEACDIWKSAHICKLNYKGSVGDMEPVGAQRMWNRSVDNLRYTKFYGDGDSKSFNTVKDTYADIEVKN